jgi:hypothetical protein
MASRDGRVPIQISSLLYAPTMTIILVYEYVHKAHDRKLVITMGIPIMMMMSTVPKILWIVDRADTVQ